METRAKVWGGGYFCAGNKTKYSSAEQIALWLMSHRLDNAHEAIPSPILPWVL